MNIGELDVDDARELVMEQLFGGGQFHPQQNRGVMRGMLMGAAPGAVSLAQSENSVSNGQMLVKQMNINVELLSKQVQKSDDKMKKHAKVINELKDENKHLKEIAVTMKIDNNKLQGEIDQLVESEAANRRQIEQAERRFDELQKKHETLQRHYNEEVRSHAELRAKYAELDTKHDNLSTDHQQLRSEFNSLRDAVDEMRISLRGGD